MKFGLKVSLNCTAALNYSTLIVASKRPSNFPKLLYPQPNVSKARKGNNYWVDYLTLQTGSLKRHTTKYQFK